MIERKKLQKGREKKGDDRKKERSYTKDKRRKEMIERKKLQKGREKKGDDRKKERNCRKDSRKRSQSCRPFREQKRKGTKQRKRNEERIS